MARSVLGTYPTDWHQDTDAAEDMGHPNKFGAQDMSEHQHPTIHNLSPVQGDHESVEDHGRKSEWHYARAGAITKEGKVAKSRPGSFAKAAVHDYRGMLRMRNYVE